VALRVARLGTPLYVSGRGDRRVRRARDGTRSPAGPCVPSVIEPVFDDAFPAVTFVSVLGKCRFVHLAKPRRGAALVSTAVSDRPF